MGFRSKQIGFHLFKWGLERESCNHSKPPKKYETASIFGATLKGDLSEFHLWVFGQIKLGFKVLNGFGKGTMWPFQTPEKKPKTPSSFGETLKRDLSEYRL